MNTMVEVLELDELSGIQLITVQETFDRLPFHLKRVLTNNEIRFILELEDRYYERNLEEEINITAFIDVVSFIKREALWEGKNIPKYIIEAVLYCEHEYLECLENESYIGTKAA
jgi:hypothetical protein